MKIIQVEGVILSHGREMTKYASKEFQESESWWELQQMKMAQFITW